MGGPSERTGRPEIDDLLDVADAERRALEEIGAVNRAENVVADVRHAELLDAHKVLDRRCEDAHAELEAAEAAGDLARLAVARDAYEAAYAEFDRVGRELIEQAQHLMGARLDRNAMFMDQMDASWKADAAALEALRGPQSPAVDG